MPIALLYRFPAAVLTLLGLLSCTTANAQDLYVGRYLGGENSNRAQEFAITKRADGFFDLSSTFAPTGRIGPYTGEVYAHYIFTSDNDFVCYFRFSPLEQPTATGVVVSVVGNSTHRCPSGFFLRDRAVSRTIAEPLVEVLRKRLLEHPVGKTFKGELGKDGFVESIGSDDERNFERNIEAQDFRQLRAHYLVRGARTVRVIVFDKGSGTDVSGCADRAAALKRELLKNVDYVSAGSFKLFNKPQAIDGPVGEGVADFASQLQPSNCSAFKFNDTEVCVAKLVGVVNGQKHCRAIIHIAPWSPDAIADRRSEERAESAKRFQEMQQSYETRCREDMDREPGMPRRCR